MGLDVYLYRIDDYPKYSRLTTEYNKRHDAIWAAFGGYGSLTGEQKENARKEAMDMAASLGLEEDGAYPGMEKMEADSRLYPEHLFKIGYLRSSYNEGGINRILQDRLSTSLYDIFGNEDNEYETQPDWQATRERAIKTLEDWRALNESMGGKSYRVAEARMNMFVQPDEWLNSGAEALRVFQEQLETHKNSNSQSYGNRYGDFYLGEPLRVAALMPGGSRFLGRQQPTVYVIYETSGEGEIWYIQALEIVIENCEWVLEQPDKDMYWLHWSG